MNITGCLLIGLLAGFVSQRGHQQMENLRLAVGVGFLGGFTTFSAYQLESHRLLENGQIVPGLVNLVGSVAAGYAAVLAGTYLSSRI